MIPNGRKFRNAFHRVFCLCKGLRRRLPWATGAAGLNGVVTLKCGDKIRGILRLLVCALVCRPTCQTDPCVPVDCDRD